MNQGLNPGSGKRIFSLSKRWDQLWGKPTSYSMDTLFFPSNKTAESWHKLLTSIYCWGYEWLELYLCFPCMPICVNSCLRYFKTTLKIAVYVQMPQQLMVFMKNIVYIHYKNSVVRLGQIAPCLSSWRVRFNSRVVYLKVVVDKVARELSLSFEHFCFIIHKVILSMPLHNRTCNLRDIQLPHYTLHSKKYCPNLLQ